MPELPEVETIRRSLEHSIVGKTIIHIEVLYPNSFSGIINQICGHTVTAIGRRGKVLNIELDNNTFLNIHLKMSGQVLVSSSRKSAVFPVKIPLADSGQMPARTTRIIIDFEDGTVLFFNDQRKFGWIRQSPFPDGTTAPDVNKPQFTSSYFSTVVKASKKPIKTLLLDQEKMAGVGNIYANDALFTAGILPSRTASSLTEDEIRKLHNAVVKTIQKGIDLQGTSATDVYVAPDGSKGGYQNHFQVYSREGKPCLVCKTAIVREKVGGRSNFYCPNCQH
jgi:formamidopyrimidine-DNA glycosylase